MSATRHMPILNAAIEAELKKESNCSWCSPGNGDSKTSHGICQRHADEFVAQIAEARKAKPAPIERLAKPQEFASQYQVTTNRGDKQIVASRKSEPKFYGAIEI